MARRRDDVARSASTVIIFVIVLIGLQMFLLTVAVDALHAGEPTQAWVSFGFSVLLAAGSVGFGRFLR